MDLIDFLLSTFNTIGSVLVSDPIKSITALAAITSALAASGGLVVGWKNLNRDITRLRVTVKRAQNGYLILQSTNEEYLLFEVYNQGATSVVINEIGIGTSRKPWKKTSFVNLVDLPESNIILKNMISPLGSHEGISIPGTIPAKSVGVFLLSYTRMRSVAAIYQASNVSSKSRDFGSQRAINAFQEFQKLEIRQGESLQISPYVLTGSGESFLGRKVVVKLGSLNDSIT